MVDPRKLQVAVLATDGFEESELTETVRALTEAGAKTIIVSPRAGSIQAFKHHDKTIAVGVDLTLDKAEPGSFRRSVAARRRLKRRCIESRTQSQSDHSGNPGRGKAYCRDLSRTVGTDLLRRGARSKADQLPYDSR